MDRHRLRVSERTQVGPVRIRCPTDRMREAESMTLPEDHSTPEIGSGARFAATSWTNVLAAQRVGSPEAEVALEKLCRTYWYPLYAYIRRKGCDPHKAQDLNQEFFYRLLKEN